MAFKGSGVEGSSADTNIIGKGTVIEGNLTTEGNLMIYGKYNGNIVCKNALTVGESGEIEGEVQASNATVGGRVKGKLIVKQKLVLESKSTLIGELKAAKLIVDEGATFHGTSDMGVNSEKPVAPAVNEKK